jgi:hypothetical protein
MVHYFHIQSQWHQFWYVLENQTLYVTLFCRYQVNVLKWLLSEIQILSFHFKSALSEKNKNLLLLRSCELKMMDRIQWFYPHRRKIWPSLAFFLSERINVRTLIAFITVIQDKQDDISQTLLKKCHPTLHSRWLLFLKVMIISLWNLLQYHSIVRWAIQAQWAEPLVFFTEVIKFYWLMLLLGDNHYL